MILRLVRRSSSESRPRMMKVNLTGLKVQMILSLSRIHLILLVPLAFLRLLTGQRALLSSNGRLPSGRMVHLSLITLLSTENMALITGLLAPELRPKSILMEKSKKVSLLARSMNSELELKTKLALVSQVSQQLLTS